MSSKTAFRDIDRKERVHSVSIEYTKRPVEERILDFDEVITGYDEETAKVEAARCLQCPEPQCCLMNCPAGNDVPEAMWLISQGDFIGAAKVFAKTSPLPEVCGRVCPNLCQQGCVLTNKVCGTLSVGKLEAFVADIARRAGALAIEVTKEKSGKRVAVVGSGPASITVAEDLVKQGHQITVYEAWPIPGGVLVYGIPNFKLDKEVVLNKIRDLEEVGVKFITNTRIGEDITVDDLLRENDAVFLGTGAGIEAKMNAPGEDLQGVYTSTDFLIRANIAPDRLPSDKQERSVVGRRVAIVGGGDTAVDCARTSIRLGAEEVTIVYRRTEAEMPGNPTERGICVDEGVNIRYLQAPTEYIGDENGRIKAMKVIKMDFGDPDASGRRRPVTIEDSEFIQKIDTVVLGIGYWPDPFLPEKTEDLATHNWGLVFADEETGATTRQGVFAAGDNVHGPDLVITAIASAHQAAKNMQAYLDGEQVELPEPPPKRKRR